MSEDIDIKIMAYADGALDSDEAQRLEAMIAADPALKSKLTRYRRSSRARIAPLFTEACDLPPPPRVEKLSAEIDNALRKAALAGPVAAPGLVARLRNIFDSVSSGDSRGWTLALGAAALALVFLGGPLLIAGMPKSDPFRIALETARSGERIRYTAGDGERTVVPVLTFKSREDGYCRLYELTRSDGSHLSGIACRAQSGAWPIKLETQAASAPVTGYATARTAIPQVLGDAVDTMIEGPSFGRAEENAVLRRGWR